MGSIPSYEILQVSFIIWLSYFGGQGSSLLRDLRGEKLWLFLLVSHGMRLVEPRGKDR